MKLIALIFFASTALLFGDDTNLSVSSSTRSQTDNEIRQKIVGTWSVDLAIGKGTETYSADGSFISKFIYNYAGHTNEEENVTGTWLVKEGILKVQVPGASSFKNYKVIRVDDRELVMKHDAKKSGGTTFKVTQIRLK